MEQRRLPHLALHPTSEKRGGAEVFQKFFLDRDRETVQASSLLGEGARRGEGGGSLEEPSLILPSLPFLDSAVAHLTPPSTFSCELKRSCFTKCREIGLNNSSV